MDFFRQFDQDLVDYWKSNGLTEKDFFCRSCGKALIDTQEVSGVHYNRKLKDFNRRFSIASTPGKKYIESSFSRWVVKGRILSRKIFFRHLCWDCFFKKLPDVEDIPRRARKGKWYKSVLQGENPVPKAWTSPSEYFKLLFDITDEELQAERVKFDTASLDSFIRRYGEQNGKKKYEEYRRRQAYTCSKEYMMAEKGLSEDEWKSYNKMRASTLPNFIFRYGEELGRRKWFEYCAHEAYAGCSLTYFQDKYGDEIGKLKYDELCRKKGMIFYSGVSQDLFRKIDAKLGNIAIGSKYETKNGELELMIEIDGIMRIARPDYVLNTKIIEFYGDYWHANPTIYKADQKLSFFNGETRSVCDIWEKDRLRVNGIEKFGYSVKIVWEKDYKENPDFVIEDCVRFLKA